MASVHKESELLDSRGFDPHVLLLQSVIMFVEIANTVIWDLEIWVKPVPDLTHSLTHSNLRSFFYLAVKHSKWVVKFGSVIYSFQISEVS